MKVCIGAYIYIYIYTICLHEHFNTFTPYTPYTCKHVHISILTYIHTYIHVSIHPCMHTCIHEYMHTYIHACMHTRIPAYMHTYSHMFILNMHIYRNRNTHILGQHNLTRLVYLLAEQQLLTADTLRVRKGSKVHSAQFPASGVLVRDLSLSKVRYEPPVPHAQRRSHP